MLAPLPMYLRMVLANLYSRSTVYVAIVPNAETQQNVACWMAR